MRKKLNFIGNIISWVCFLAALVLFLMFVPGRIMDVWNGTGPEHGEYVLGYKIAHVRTGSMEPYMLTNGMAIQKDVDDISDIKEGDVISFIVPYENGTSDMVCHRIISIDEEGYITTKGDNNRVTDSEPITFDQVDGKIVAVFNQTAWIYEKMQTPVGIVLLVSMVIGVICAYILIKNILKDFINRKIDEYDEKHGYKEPEPVAENSELPEKAE